MRSWFFGLAADGERGVREVLDTYRVSIDRTLIGLGKSSIHELSPDDLVVSEGFFRKTAKDLPLARRSGVEHDSVPPCTAPVPCTARLRVPEVEGLIAFYRVGVLRWYCGSAS